MCAPEYLSIIKLRRCDWRWHKLVGSLNSFWNLNYWKIREIWKLFCQACLSSMFVKFTRQACSLSFKLLKKICRACLTIIIVKQVVQACLLLLKLLKKICPTCLSSKFFKHVQTSIMFDKHVPQANNSYPTKITPPFPKIPTKTITFSYHQPNPPHSPSLPHKK